MTGSEISCTNFLIDFFFKEFVYRDLYYFEGKQKKELCDGLIEFQDSYIVFQIKEKNGSSSEEWLRKKVYKKAVSQIKDTIRMMSSGNLIEVTNYTGDEIELKANKRILPVIIFDSDETEYDGVHVSSVEEGLRINILKMSDFQKVLEAIQIPYDIVMYLSMRSAYFDQRFPDLLVTEESDELTTFSRIENEDGFISYYITVTNRNKEIMPEAMEGFRFIIHNFRERLIQAEKYNTKEYKEIVELLLRFDRNAVQQFMVRWDVCVEHCLRKEETADHYLINIASDVGYLFITQPIFDAGCEGIDCILRLFKHRFNLKTAVAVVFKAQSQILWDD